MNEKTAIEQLQAMADDPKDSLKKFLAKEILTHDEPLDFFSLVKKFGLETVYHYEDLDEEEMQEFYNTYSKEIIQLQEENKVQHTNDRDRSWFALEKTTEKISINYVCYKGTSGNYLSAAGRAGSGLRIGADRFSADPGGLDTGRDRRTDYPEQAVTQFECHYIDKNELPSLECNIMNVSLINHYCWPKQTSRYVFRRVSTALANDIHTELSYISAAKHIFDNIPLLFHRIFVSLHPCLKNYFSTT